MAGKRKLPRVVYRVYRQIFWQHPSAYRLVPFTAQAKSVLDSDYDYWATGFPRTGNTFVRNALELCMPPDKTVASHRHNPAFIIRALRHRKPGILVIREPVDTAISSAIFTGHPLLHDLVRYIDFYCALRPYRDELFVARFSEVVRDFGPVLARWKARYGVECDDFVHTPEAEAKVMERIDSDIVRRDGAVDERTISRPSEDRRRLKAEMLARFEHDAALRVRREEAEQVYAEFAPS
jgi:hypothetical protein